MTERKNVLAFLTWRPGARSHILKRADVPYDGDIHDFISYCGLTAKETGQTAVLVTQGAATLAEIEQEAANKFLCRRCHRRYREAML